MFGAQLVMRLRLANRVRTAAVALGFLISLVVLSSERCAWAQSESDRATARNLAAEGYTALKTQDYSIAEDRFRRADGLVHAPTLVLDHARALIGLRRFVEAQERLELVLREGVPENAPWSWKKAAQDASFLIDDVKPKVAWLTINIQGPKESVVTVDSTQVPAVAIGVRRATDPGRRRISATASGYLPKEVTVSLPEGGERAVTLEMEIDPSTRPKAAVLAPKPTKAVVRYEAPEPKSKTLTYVSLGTGAVGLSTGIVTGLLFLSARNELVKKCNANTCDKASFPDVDNVHSRYVTYGTVSGVALAVGLVGSGLGLWMLSTDDSKPSKKERPRVAVQPYVLSHSIGVTGEF